MAASLQQVLRSRMRRALVCKADVGCLGDVLRLAVEFGGEAAQGVPVKAFNDHGDLRRTRPPPRRAAQHGVAHLLKGGFCQQSAGQVVVGLLIREDGPQAVAVTDFPKRRRAARVMSGVLSITSLMTRAAPERQPSASCRSMTVAKPQSTPFGVNSFAGHITFTNASTKAASSGLDD